MSKTVQIDSLQLDLIDQFAPVRLQVEAFRPTQNLHDRLWEKLKLYIEAKAKEQPAVLRGRKYEIHLTECSSERKVKASAFERLKKLFGAKRFWSLVKFPLAPVDAMFDEEQRKNFIDTTQTGPRRIAAVIEIDGPATAKAA